MITTKEIYYTIEDVFKRFAFSTSPQVYPNVKYNNTNSNNSELKDLIYYKSTSAVDLNFPVLEIASDNEKLFNNILNYIQLYLSDYSCFKIECEVHENIEISTLLPKRINYDYNTYPQKFIKSVNEFSMRFVSWIKESIEFWIPKFEIYDNFDYSEFLTNPDKVITKQDISTPRVAKSRSQVRKINDTPEEVGDFTGDGYVNQIELVDNTDNAPTGTDQFDSTVTEHDVEKQLRILNECLAQVRNLYRQWMIDFRRKVLID